MNDVTRRVADIRQRIAAAYRRSDRAVESVQLVGASKRQPIEHLRSAWDAGLRTFGENRVQELVAKAPQMPAEADWHLIGPLQSNKVKPAVSYCSTIHSIDRPKIARAIDRQAAAQGRRLEGLIEVNLGREASKHGFPPDADDELSPLAELEHLEIVGLMAIPPFESSVEDARRWFRTLREIRDRIFGSAAWSGRPGYLSMGMSHDFEIAIEEGATHVRVGSALFGPRPT